MNRVMKRVTSALVGQIMNVMKGALIIGTLITLTAINVMRTAISATKVIIQIVHSVNQGTT